MEAESVLGQVAGFSGQGRAAYLTPLLTFLDDTYRPADHRQFPNRGQVVLFDPPPTVGVGQYYSFAIERTTNFDPSNRSHDAYLATDLTLLDCVIDARPIGDENEIRTTLMRGIALPISSEKLHPFVRISAERLVGPLQLVQRNGLWIIQEPSALSALDLVAVSEAELINLHGPLQLVRSRIVRRIGHVDWSDDSQLVAHVLKDLRTLDPDFARAVDVTRKSIDHLASLLSGGGHEGISREQIDLRKHRLLRAQTILKSREPLFHVSQELIDIILTLPDVSRTLAAARDDVIRTSLDEARRTIDAELTDRRRHLQALHEERAATDAQLHAARKELSRIERTIADQDHLFAEALRKRLDAVSSNPADFHAELAILRAALAPARDSRHSPQRISQSVQRIASFRDAVQEAERRLERSDLPTLLASTCSSAAVASSAVLLYGNRSNDVVRTLADALAGGRVIDVPISPAIVSPSDVLQTRLEWWRPHHTDGPTVSEYLHDSAGLVFLFLRNANCVDLGTVLIPLIEKFHELADSRVRPIWFCEVTPAVVRLPLDGRSFGRVPLIIVPETGRVHSGAESDGVTELDLGTFESTRHGVAHSNVSAPQLFEGLPAPFSGTAARFFLSMLTTSAVDTDRALMETQCTLLAPIDAVRPELSQQPDELRQRVQEISTTVKMLRT